MFHTTSAVSRRLRAEGAPPPEHLVASGRWAPRLRDPEPPVCDRPLDDRVAALRRLGGTSEAVLAQRELMELIHPMLRADFALGDRYVHRPAPPLDHPVTALGGVDDPPVPLPSLEAWGVHTTARFRAEQLPGGHFYLQEHREPVLRIVSAPLAEPPLGR